MLVQRFIEYILLYNKNLIFIFSRSLPKYIVRCNHNCCLLSYDNLNVELLLEVSAKDFIDEHA